jgi:circadian clock protein KaiB
VKQFVFQLFINPGTIDSTHAVKNIQLFCEKHLKGMYEIEVIDIKEHPGWATKENVFALPLLIKKMPLPEDRLIGDLSDTKKMLKMLRVEN